MNTMQQKTAPYKTAAQAVEGALTAIKAPTTKAEPDNTIYERFRRRAGYQTKGNPELERLLESVARFASCLNYTKPHWLTISGPSGIGKTHLAKALYKQFMEQNRFSHFPDYENMRIVGNSGWLCDWRKLCDDIRSGNYTRLVEDLCDEWFVVLDDFGTERDPTGFIASASDRILNSRMRKWTFITTNLTLAEIADRIDSRIASRMIRDGNMVVEVEAQDYALQPETK